MNWENLKLVVLGLAAFGSAFTVALWISLTIWSFRDMRARTRDAFAQLLAALMVLVLGPLGILLYLLLRPRETLAEKYERSLEEEALLQDVEERTICPACKQPIENDYMVCPICHTRLRQPCMYCNRLIHPRWGVCPYCGKAQKPLPNVDRAGRVTLQDLEQEEGIAQPAAAEPVVTQSAAVPNTATVTAPHTAAQQLPAAASGPVPVAELEQANQDASFQVALEPDWEELDIEDFEPADDNDQADLSASDQQQETEAEEKAQGLLSSLFKPS